MSPLSFFFRLFRHFRREVWQRRLPHGLLSLRYLWPGQDERIRLHRRLWWQGPTLWPRPLWLLLQAGLWLRWVSWHAPLACFRVLRSHGVYIEAEERLPRHVQAWRIVKLALLWCIPPAQACQFRLYRNHEQALDYVYDHECAAYHAWRSEGLGCSLASRRLLKDKAAFTAAMQSQGITMAPILAYASRGRLDTLPLKEGLKQAGRVFCKMNSGNQGQGAFSAWLTSTGLAGCRFTGQSLPDTLAVESAWLELLKLDDALVQPCLTNHPKLAPLSFNGEVITVRFISQWEERGINSPSASLSCLCATLEVPAGMDQEGRLYYAILPIAPATGGVGAPICGVAEPPDIRAATARVARDARNLDALPEWLRIVESSCSAHRRYALGVRAVAWDWVLTPKGPVLLEGNVGWGCSVPQLIRPGLGFARPDP